MPHKCARCGTIYDDTSAELISGCSCGARVFLYLKERPGRSEEDTIEELKIKEIGGEDLKRLDREFGMDLEKTGRTIHLDLENLHQIDKGRYRIDIKSLMKGDPLIMKVGDGVYYIDIIDAMSKGRKK
ncbi:MAG: Zn-ribbon domain-containing protein [Candidatus Altiarchaeales archaeon]|nr:Zn-ribbon domain-containing protein [Candidatus Altiarchaeota archaeon]MCG2782349.1 Zn-ribbon domain-containing protein [Candidatus Altiarchaeales archaeon]MBU4266874.1 Zn-ribbon domain-containing protein [Candidatus Altiarchaeota archaeon]MBU4341333.1 Zn-ribbon domain-containing protein [Candidatus Altiarchaeota archaeon]MBU4406812.1 Zn-ribbon domain-containing protein [Candidatus Altiarchaeota archaeon]